MSQASSNASGRRVVVIGAGYGGLAIAVRLQARGFQVTLLDRRDGPGGRGYVYRDQGFIFDAGPTVITAPWLIEELFELAGQKASDHIQFLKVDPFYRIRFHDGAHFDYSADPEKMAAEISKFNPADVEGYRRFVVESERIFHRGFEQLGDVPFSSLGDMVRIIPSLVKLGSFRTVYGMVSKYIKDDRLRQIMSFHPLLVGGNPFDTTSIYALIHFLERKWGVWYAKGGTGAVVQALVDLFVSQGGKTMWSADVDEILVDEAGKRATGVRLKGGQQLDADIVVSNADAGATYRQLVPARVRRHWTDARISRTRFSMGLFVAYFGTKRRYPDVRHHTILLGPRYQGLLDDIFNKKILADDFSLYLHRPSASDPGLAPEGCDSFYVLAPVPNLGGDPAKVVDWEKHGEVFRDRIYQSLEETVLPGLRESIVTTRHITPLHFRDELRSELGAGFSVQPILTQSAWFRPHNQSEELPNLYLVGAGTHPGAGMPGVISSARVVDRMIPRLDGDGGRDPIAGTHAR